MRAMQEPISRRMVARCGRVGVAMASAVAALALLAAPSLVAPPEANAQGPAGLCKMDLYPTGQFFFIPSHHAVLALMTCDGGGEDVSAIQHYRGLRVTSNTPIAQLASADVGGCSPSLGGVECEALIGLTDGPQELIGDLQFDRPVDCDGSGQTTVSAEYELEDQNGTRQWFPMPVTGPCAGNIAIKGGPRKCADRDFKVRVTIPKTLRRRLIDAVNPPGEHFAEEPRLIATLTQKGKQGAKRSRLPGLGGKPSLGGFKLKVPASRLRAGRYVIEIKVEGNSPDDYPNAALAFKRC